MNHHQDQQIREKRGKWGHPKIELRRIIFYYLSSPKHPNKAQREETKGTPSLVQDKEDIFKQVNLS